MDLERAKLLNLHCTVEGCARIRQQYKNYCNACYLRIQRNTPEGKRIYKNEWLQKLYGITIDDFEMLLNVQDFQCAICSKELSLLGNKTNVDHCHNTGRVRGLLCSSCNSLIALAKESKEILLNAIAYLEK